MEYKSVPGVILTSVCGHYYLVNPGETIEINETAVFYWNLLCEGATEEELAELAGRQYDIDDMELLRMDVQTLVALLKERHMIS